MYIKNKKNKKIVWYRHIWLHALFFGVLVAIAAFFAYGRFFAGTSTTPVSTASSTTKGESAGPPTTPNEDDVSSPSDQEDTKKNTVNRETGVLLEPSCTFVSNHHPDPSASLQSTCSTTPGAKVTISFTKDEITKSLPVTEADSGGGAYWTWEPQDYGLTAGSWQISATASYGSQTKTATDALPLEVQP